MTTPKTFFWIGLKVTRPDRSLIFLEGAFNTREGRDARQFKRSKLWAAAGIEFKPFETLGKNKNNALTTAKDLLAASDTPQEVRQDVQAEFTPSQNGVGTRPTFPQQDQTEITNEQVEERFPQTQPGVDNSQQIDTSAQRVGVERTSATTPSSLAEASQLFRQSTLGDDFTQEDIEIGSMDGFRDIDEAIAAEREGFASEVDQVTEEDQPDQPQEQQVNRVSN